MRTRSHQRAPVMREEDVDFDPPFGPNDPFHQTDILIAHSPDYRHVPDTAPLYAHEWTDLLAQCRSALERRREAYPRMIERRMIPADVAQRDIAAWEMLSTEWAWINSGVGRAPPPATIGDRIAAVELAMIRVRQELGRGNRSHAMYPQAHLIQALHWHLVHQADGEPRVYWSARINHRIRAEQGARYCETCDRWVGGKLAFDCTRPDCERPERIAA